MLDDLADASNFPSSSDDLISTTYSPQVSEQVYELQELQRRLLVLQSWIEPFIPEGSTEEKITDFRLSKNSLITILDCGDDVLRVSTRLTKTHLT